MGADLLAVQSLMQALQLAVTKLSSGVLLPPPPVPSQSRSRSRRQRRQATLRKLYAASPRGSVPASEDKASQVAISVLVQAS